MSDNDKIIRDGFAKVKDIVYRQTMEILKSFGYYLIGYGRDVHTFNNLTFATENSYGFAVYYNRQMVVSPQFLGQTKLEKEYPFGITHEAEVGTENAANFLYDYVPIQRGWSLVVTTGTYYSDYLEKECNLDVLTGTFDLAKDNVIAFFSSEWRVI